MFTYEIAPVYVLMEEVTLEKMREFLGWKEPGRINKTNLFKNFILI